MEPPKPCDVLVEDQDDFCLWGTDAQEAIEMNQARRTKHRRSRSKRTLSATRQFSLFS